MENDNDRPTETKTLMNNNFIKFSFVYWIAFIVILISISYSQGNKRLSNYSFTEGKVVDKIWLPVKRRRTKTRDYPFSQWQYVVGNDTFLFVDKRFLFYDEPIGTKRKVIYLNSRHDEAMVYNFLFWISGPMIMVATLIALFVFAIWMFTVHWNDKTWFSKRRY
jgi:hypothetical protein